MRTVRYLARAAALGGLSVGVLGSRVAAAETVAVVTASPNSEPAARYLATQTELPVVRRKSRNARDLDALVSEARDSWGDDLVVVLDTDRALVSVVRPRDGTVGSRRLDPSAAAAPYVVALAAAELMEIVRDAPPARAAALPEPPSSGVAPRWVFGASVLQTVSISGDVSLVRPEAGVDVEFLRSQSAWWLGLGIHGTGLVPMHRDEVLVLPSGTDEHGSVDYNRNEVALRFELGEHSGRSEVSGFCDAGLAFIETTARDHGAVVVARDQRTAPWFGLGAELRYTLWAGLSLGVAAGGAVFPSTSRFYTAPEGSTSAAPAFSEGKLELRAGAGLAWSTGS